MNNRPTDWISWIKEARSFHKGNQFTPQEHINLRRCYKQGLTTVQAYKNILL